MSLPGAPRGAREGEQARARSPEEFQLPAGYVSFLLRMWQVDDSGWRASLMDPMTRHIDHFASLEALIDFLRQQPRVNK